MSASFAAFATMYDETLHSLLYRKRRPFSSKNGFAQAPVLTKAERSGIMGNNELWGAIVERYERDWGIFWGL